MGPDEWEVYRLVRLAALEEAPYAFGSHYADEALAPEDRWRHAMRDRSRFVAESGGDVLGTVSGGDSSLGGQAAITAMWVDPHHRGRGVGDALVTAVVQWARDRGYGDIVLCVREGNVKAERLYERNGFTRTGRLCADGEKIEYEMWRKL